MELSWEEKAEVMVEWYKKVFENPPVLPLLIKLAALGNLKVNFHCAHWHSFFPLREDPPLISVFFNSLYDPFGSPCRGQKRCSNRYAIRLADHQRFTPCGCVGWDHRDKVDGALRNLLITFRFSAIFLVISGKRYIFAEKSNV